MYERKQSGRNGYGILFAIIIGALVLTNVLNYGASNMASWFLAELLMLPGVVIGLSFHEFGHAAVSNALGDPTPKNQGRLTLNPKAHMDVIGFLCLLFAGFGWGVPVEINPRYYKHRRRDEFLVSIAGVTMNLLLALALAVVLRLLFAVGLVTAASTNSLSASGILYQVFAYAISINIVLMVFNLIPIPPLDGFGILTQIFDLRKYRWYSTFCQWGIYLLLALVLFNVLDVVLLPITNGITNLIFQHIVF